MTKLCKHTIYYVDSDFIPKDVQSKDRTWTDICSTYMHLTEITWYLSEIQRGTWMLPPFVPHSDFQIKDTVQRSKQNHETTVKWIEYESQTWTCQVNYLCCCLCAKKNIFSLSNSRLIMLIFKDLPPQPTKVF